MKLTGTSVSVSKRCTSDQLIMPKIRSANRVEGLQIEPLVLTGRQWDGRERFKKGKAPKQIILIDQRAH